MYTFRLADDDGISVKGDVGLVRGLAVAPASASRVFQRDRRDLSRLSVQDSVGIFGGGDLRHGDQLGVLRPVGPASGGSALYLRSVAVAIGRSGRRIGHQIAVLRIHKGGHAVGAEHLIIGLGVDGIRPGIALFPAVIFLVLVESPDVLCRLAVGLDGRQIEVVQLLRVVLVFGRRVGRAVVKRGI